MTSGRRLAPLLRGCALLALATPAAASESTGTSVTSTTGFEARVSAPGDFADIDGPRETLVDLYYGGRRIGEARVRSHSGTLRFLDPAAVAELIPNISDKGQVAGALTGSMPGNAHRVCSLVSSRECGSLSPSDVGVILDEDRFRLDLFVNPVLLAAVSSGPTGFLAPSTAGLALASSVGLSLSGNAGSAPLYHLQSRNVIGWGAGRLRSNVALASKQGLLVDNLVAEFDRPDQRYSAGLFWARGSQFAGERRVLGVGFETQLDTRIDKESIQGTPLTLFMQQPGRVEILVDGRLVDSRLYEAGNNILDTSALPAGSYDLLLRIQEGGGATREERRFFVRSAEMAPLGRPLFHAMAGLLANSTKGKPVSLSRQIYYRAGANVRLSRLFGVEASVTGTQDKLLGEAGLFVVTGFARLRASALYSSAGDTGAIIQLASARSSGLQFAFDLRRVTSRSGQPLLPLPEYRESFVGAGADRSQLAIGSFTQASGSVGYQLGPVSLNLTGYLRQDGDARDYNMGPALSWQAVQGGGLQLTVLADAQKSRAGMAGFFGARLVMVRGSLSTVSSSGASFDGRSTSGSRMRGVGSINAQWNAQPWEDSRLALGAGLDRGSNSSSGQLSGTLQSRLGTVRTDLLHRFGGSTSYVLNLQSGGALAGGAVTLGGRELDESALIASVRGRGGAFELVVDGVSRGRVSSGGTLPLFLRPYRAYKVQIRPLASGAIEVDTNPRTVTLYPGNVDHQVWQADKLVTLFGRAVDIDGRPLARASIQGKRELTQTDEDGWFQLDVAGSKPLQFARADGSSCRVALDGADLARDYASLGDVTCR